MAIMWIREQPFVKNTMLDEHIKTIMYKNIITKDSYVTVSQFSPIVSKAIKLGNCDKHFFPNNKKNVLIFSPMKMDYTCSNKSMSCILQ